MYLPSPCVACGSDLSSRYISDTDADTRQHIAIGIACRPAERAGLRRLRVAHPRHADPCQDSDDHRNPAEKMFAHMTLLFPLNGPVTGLPLIEHLAEIFYMKQKHHTRFSMLVMSLRQEGTTFTPHGAYCQ